MVESFPPPDFIATQSSLTGVEVYMPAPKNLEPNQEIVNFTCPQCGAATAYSAVGGGLICSHCGYFEAPEGVVVGRLAEKFEFTLETMQAAALGWGIERKELVCENCGASTSVPAENLTHICPFCSSNKVIQHPAPTDTLRPRFTIPFKIEPAQCTQIVSAWLGSSWMTPKSLKTTASPDRYTSVYLPYWTFSADTQANWKAEVGHQETERYYSNGEWKERTVTRWHWESGQVHLRIDDLLVEGSGRLSTLLLSKISNFDLGALAPYEPKYLAGHQAQTYDIPLEKAWETGRQRMREKTRQACLGQASTSQVRNFSMSLDFAEETWRYILLPIYLNTYRYENTSYQIMVNGQNGQVAGQRPVDWNKIWLVIAALLSPGLLLGLLGLLTAAFGVGIGIGAVGFVLLVIGLVISVIIFVKAQSMDDA